MRPASGAAGRTSCSTCSSAVRTSPPPACTRSFHSARRTAPSWARLPTCPTRPTIDRWRISPRPSRSTRRERAPFRKRRRGRALVVGTLVDLQAEFAGDAGGLLVGVAQDLRELFGRGRKGDRARLLDQVAVLGRFDDRADLPVEERDHRLRGARAAAEAEPAETHEGEALLGECRYSGRRGQALGARDRENAQPARLVLRQ